MKQDIIQAVKERSKDYYLIGNSVPPPMAEAMGNHVAGLLKAAGG